MKDSERLSEYLVDLYDRGGRRISFHQAHVGGFRSAYEPSLLAHRFHSLRWGASTRNSGGQQASTVLCCVSVFQHRPTLCQEFSEGKNMLCGTICLDHSGSPILSRISQSVYEGCRQAKIQLSGFPDFQPLLAALKAGSTPQRSKVYRVTAENAGRLVVLESFAKRWMESDATKDRAEHEIQLHNENYNADGEWWYSDGTGL